MLSVVDFKAQFIFTFIVFQLYRNFIVRTDKLLIFQIFDADDALFAPWLGRDQVAHPLQLDHAGNQREGGKMAAEINQIQRHAADEGFAIGFIVR